MILRATTAVVLLSLLVLCLCQTKLQAAVSTPACKSNHAKGYHLYLHAICEMDYPTSIEIRGNKMTGRYLVFWLLSCYDSVRSWRAGAIANNTSGIEPTLLHQPFDYRIDGDHNQQAYIKMMSAVHCSLEVWFNRFGQASAHKLSGRVLVGGQVIGELHDESSN